MFHGRVLTEDTVNLWSKQILWLHNISIITFLFLCIELYFFSPYKFPFISRSHSNQLLSICNYCLCVFSEYWGIWVCVWSVCLCAWMSSLQRCMQIHLHESWLHLPPDSNERNSSDSWPYRCFWDNLLNALNLFRIQSYYKVIITAIMHCMYCVSL